jgi:hypothetical protein
MERIILGEYSFMPHKVIKVSAPTRGVKRQEAMQKIQIKKLDEMAFFISHSNSLRSVFKMQSGSYNMMRNQDLSPFSIISE